MELTRDDLALLSHRQLAAIDAWWRACNYLTVGQIYLKDNPLLERPLIADDIKPRLLGHWAPAQGFRSYARMCRESSPSPTSRRSIWLVPVMAVPRW
jgi:xylulose-5-phosphate/fructose-6-phosphate phosphoketolase